VTLLDPGPTTTTNERKPGDFQRHPTTDAPYVDHPTDVTKAGMPKRVMYGRPSSAGDAVSGSSYSLVKWKERKLLEGAAILLDNDQFDFDPTDGKSLDKLAGRCHEAAGSKLSADRGTHVHKLTEHDDRGWRIEPLLAEGEALGIPAALQQSIVEGWREFRKRLNVTAVGIEQTVVNDRWRLAGTLDRIDVAGRDIVTELGTLAAGEAFIGDIKTGGLKLDNNGNPEYWVKYSVQLAAYADAVPYAIEGHEEADELDGAA
jgi:hypothetical protein